MTSTLSRFARDSSGVSAIEAAVILPIIAILAMVGFDMARYAVYSRKIQIAAATVGELAARNDSGKISQTDMEAFYYAQLVVFPEAMKNAAASGSSVLTTLSSSLSGVTFTKSASCASNCKYTPYVAWTGGAGRPCSVALQSASNTAQPTSTTLPEASFGTGFLIVADVAYDFKPVFMTSIISTIRIARSYYIAPRYVTSIAYSTSGGSSMSRSCTVPSY